MCTSLDKVLDSTEVDRLVLPLRLAIDEELAVFIGVQIVEAIHLMKWHIVKRCNVSLHQEKILMTLFVLLRLI